MATMTGPCGPDSPFDGRAVALTRRRCERVERGMLIGAFAQWYPGGPQPSNLLAVERVCAVHMQGRYDQWGAYMGQDVTLTFGDRSITRDGMDTVFEVTFR